MNDTVVQSTLRQLQSMARSRALWSTFLAILALFVLTGPYGTGEKMSFWPRLVYWTLLQGAGWIITTCLSAFANAALARFFSAPLIRMMVGSVFAALPIGAVISLANGLFFTKPVDAASVTADALAALPLCIIFCFLSFLTSSSSRAADVAGPRPGDEPPASIDEPPPILNRLPPQKRGEVLRLSVQDHYTEIVTTRGRQLVLLRFADALREIGDTPGLQVHRSHWVADVNVISLRKAAGRFYIVTRDGMEIPVSRSHSVAAQGRFATHAPAR
ncbi:LytTR family DNA-binding domain-containing protein [Agrobacterium sp. NPDC089420]|uniref:LytTR family DNA-binding domain-containing protein n=1 Tax=Agrobacterium sp. NPDC089420 TaxID=3363918 RepID=UPI00384D852D